MTSGTPHAWTTACELQFLNGLGTFSSSHRCTRLELLRKYQQAMLARDHDDGIRVQIVAQHVQALIVREERACRHVITK